MTTNQCYCLLFLNFLNITNEENMCKVLISELKQAVEGDNLALILQLADGSKPHSACFTTFAGSKFKSRC